MTDEMPAGNNDTQARPPDWQAPSLEEMLDMEVDAWRPSVGDVIIGRVLRVTIGGTESAFGSYPIVMIQRDYDGQCINVHSFHRVLRRELARQEVGEGDRVGIKYMGEVKGGDYGKFENYRVIKDHAIMQAASSERTVVKDEGTQERPQQQPRQRRQLQSEQDEIPF